MKYQLLAMLMILMVACGTEDQVKKESLTGTRWAAFQYSSTINGDDVYQILYFKPDGIVERYSAESKVSIIGEPIEFQYSYDHPDVSIMIDGQTYEGRVNDGFIRIFEKDYEAL